MKFFLFFIFLSCAITTKRPKYEMAIAKSAFQAAKKASAARFAALKYRKAEISYLKARELYKKKIFDKAKRLAKMTIYYSETVSYTHLTLPTILLV